jgi:hypothetical protein
VRAAAKRVDELQIIMKNKSLKKNILSKIISLSLAFLSCQGQLKAVNTDSLLNYDVRQIIRRANITYDSSAFQTGHPYVPLLVSNGVVGGCFDHMGFQSTPSYDYPQGRTAFGYIRHYARHESSRQIQFPLACCKKIR